MSSGELLLAGRVRLLAVLAERAHQALGQDAEQRVSEVEGVDLHVEQARDGLRRRVRVSVDSTRWPVSEASTPVAGRLVVAHLADHDDVGVARRNARMAFAKVKSIFGCTCTWRRPGCVISTGSSAVQIFMSTVLMCPRPGVQGRGLARSRSDRPPGRCRTASPASS
jgi:hypothetical protein